MSDSPVLREFNIDAAIDNARHELDLGRWRIARVWLNLACDLEREEKHESANLGRSTASDLNDRVVDVPVMRDGGVCVHGYGTYVAGGQRWHRATGGVCNPNPALDEPQPTVYATAQCVTCGWPISANSWYQDQLEVGAHPGDHETIPGMIMWEGWTHDDVAFVGLEQAAWPNHEALPASPVTLTEQGRTLTR